MTDEKMYAEVSKNNEILIVDDDLDLLKENADEGNHISMLQEVPLEDKNPELAEAYAEKDYDGNILSIWQDKEYVDNYLLEGSHTILLQEVEN